MSDLSPFAQAAIILFIAFLVLIIVAVFMIGYRNGDIPEHHKQEDTDEKRTEPDSGGCLGQVGAIFLFFMFLFFLLFKWLHDLLGSRNFLTRSLYLIMRYQPLFLRQIILITHTIGEQEANNLPTR